MGLERVHEKTARRAPVMEGVKGRAHPLLGAHQGAVIQVLRRDVHTRDGGQLTHKGVDGQGE